MPLAMRNGSLRKPDEIQEAHCRIKKMIKGGASWYFASSPETLLGPPHCDGDSNKPAFHVLAFSLSSSPRYRLDCLLFADFSLLKHTEKSVSPKKL